MEKQRLAFIITVKRKSEAKKQCVSVLQFRETIKIIEKYYDVKLDLVYMIWYDIRY